MTWPPEVLPSSAADLAASARHVCHVAPGHSLVQFRAAAWTLAGEWLSSTEGREPSSLYGRLEALAQRTPKGHRAVEALHRVRQLGNCGAHPEQFPDPPTGDHVEQANEAFHHALMLWATDVCGVAEDGLPPLPALPETDWDTICKEALLDRNLDALLIVAAHVAGEARAARDRLHRESKNPLVDVESALKRSEDGVELYRMAWRHHRSAAAAREAAIILLDDLQRDLPEAWSLLVNSAMGDDSGAKWRLGRLHIERDPRFAKDADWDEGVRLLRSAAEDGHPAALHHLARLSAEGKLGKPDPDETLAWLRQSAEAGFPQASVDVVAHLLQTSRPDKAAADIRTERERVGGLDQALVHWIDFIEARAAGERCQAEDFSPLEPLLFRKYVPARLARARWHLRQAPSLDHFRAAANDAASALQVATEPGAWNAARQVLFRVMRGLAKAGWRSMEPDTVALSSGAWLALTNDQLPSPGLFPPTVDAISACLIAAGQNGSLDPDERQLLRRAFPDLGKFPMGTASLRPKLVRAARSPARNAPCVCGSGRSFKGCCKDLQPLPIWPGEETLGAR
jgi:TPR repeat protein